MTSPQAIYSSLKGYFTQSDKDGDGLISIVQLQQYTASREKVQCQPQHYQWEELKMSLNKVKESTNSSLAVPSTDLVATTYEQPSIDLSLFIIWVLSHRYKATNIPRILLEVKEMVRDTVAAPQMQGNNNEPIVSHLTVKCDAQIDHANQTILKVNYSEAYSQAKRAHLKTVVQCQIAPIFVYLSFATTPECASQLVRQIQGVIEIGLSLLKQLESDSNILNSVTATCLASQNGHQIYVLVQCKDPLFVELTRYLVQLTKHLSSKCELSANLEASLNLSQLLAGQFSAAQLANKLNLEVSYDRQLLMSLKRMFAKLINKSETDIPAFFQVFFLLFEQCKFQVDLVSMLSYLLPPSIPTHSIPMLGSLKQIGVQSMVADYIPEGASLWQNLTTKCSPKGELYVGFGPLGASIEFNLAVQGFFGLF